MTSPVVVATSPSLVPSASAGAGTTAVLVSLLVTALVAVGAPLVATRVSRPHRLRVPEAASERTTPSANGARSVRDLPDDARLATRSSETAGRRRRAMERWPPPRAAAYALGIIVLGVVVSTDAAIVVLAVAALAPPVRRLFGRTRDRRIRQASIPDAVDLLVLAIRAGMTPRHATGRLADLAAGAPGRAFAAVETQLARGSDLATALGALVDVLGPEIAPVVDALSHAERHGSPLGPVLDQISFEMRQRRRAEADADARRLPVRLSFPLVAFVLPAFVLVAIAPAVLAALSSLSVPAW